MIFKKGVVQFVVKKIGRRKVDASASIMITIQVK